MSALLIIIHVIVCIALILIVLLQTGKGADMGAAFGGGSNQTLFGSTGASTFLSKATTFAAIVFMITSLGLAYMSGQGKSGSSIMDQVEAPAVTQPAAEAETKPETDVSAETPAPASSEAVTTAPEPSVAETVTPDAETAVPVVTPSSETTVVEDGAVTTESSEAPVPTPSEEAAPTAVPEAGTDTEKVQ